MADEEKEVPSKGRLWAEGLKIHWRLIVLIVWPFLCALIFIYDSGKEFRCLYVVILMAIYWVCEVLPLGVTGLLPIALFPLLGILPTKTTCSSYLNDTTVMFMCSIFIAFAIESSNLHRRIALKTILIIGTTHLRLTFGFMTVTMVVSLWIINTAATAMMAPVALAVLQELEGSGFVTVFLPPRNEEEEENPYPSPTTRCYFLGIAYASTVGGVGTLIGTGTNLTFKGIFEEKFPDGPAVDFADWIAAMLPQAVVMNTLTWFALSWQYLGLFRKSGDRRQSLESKEQPEDAATVAREVIRVKYAELGPFSWAEAWVTVWFFVVVVLWITCDPNWMYGWGPAISSVKIHSSTPGVVTVLALFALPAVPTVFYCLSSDPEKRPTRQANSILVWKEAALKFPWGLLFLLGSGFAVSKGSDESGMSAMIGQALKALQSLNSWVVLLLVCLVASIITEFTSNVAIANIILPVIADMAVFIETNPTYLMLPATVCCSFSFMLPVGTPANAIVAGYANIRTTDMMIAGILPTIITLAIVVVLFPTYGSLIYPNLTEFPDWAKLNKTD